MRISDWSSDVCSSDLQLRRHFGRGHRVTIGPDALAVGGRKGQVARARAGRDDDMLRGQGFAALPALPFQLAGRGELAIAHLYRAFVSLHTVLSALVAPFRHPISE